MERRGWAGRSITGYRPPWRAGSRCAPRAGSPAGPRSSRNWSPSGAPKSTASWTMPKRPRTHSGNGSWVAGPLLGQTLLDGGVLDVLLELFESAHFDLAHALAADAVMLRQVFQRGRFVPQPALRQDMALALVQVGHGALQQGAALAQLLALGQGDFLRILLVHQPILPFPLAIGAQRRIERVVGAGKASVHVDDVLLRHVQLGRDLGHVFRRQVAFVDRLHLALQLAQVEE